MHGNGHCLAPLWNAALILLLLARAQGPAEAIEPDQVLVVYNRFDADSVAVKDHYLKRRPGVLQCDIGAEDLVGRHTITYSEYLTWIVRPIRSYLGSSEGLAQQIVCIVLTKGIPHLLDDIDQAGIGDFPYAMEEEWLKRGDFTAASVDSELTLLWQDLIANEEQGAFDSKADGFIINPYYGIKRPVTGFTRRYITERKRFIDIVQVGPGQQVHQGGWEAASPEARAERFRPGDFYLVARLDGRTVQDVRAAIDRAQSLVVDPAQCVIVLDANIRAELDRADYRKARSRLLKAGWRVVYDESDVFLTGERVKSPVIAYASYGRNDNSSNEPEDVSYIAGFEFSPGAVFNTLESFNGRDFGGAGDREKHPQTQLADFIAAGGTFGIANVWEPFSLSAASNEHLLDSFLNRGLTFVEAAYTSIPLLSWQQIVVGDPLARIEVAPKSADAKASSRR